MFVSGNLMKFVGLPVLAVLTVALWVPVLRNDESRGTPGANFSVAPSPIADSTTSPSETVAFIGDSYTAGTGSESGAGFVTPLAATEGWNAVNLGQGGTGYLVNPDQDPASSLAGCGLDYCPNYPEQIAAAVEANPDVVVVSGGRNNVASGPDALAAGIPSFYKQLRRALPDAILYATSPLWDDDEPAPLALHTIALEVRSAVEAVGGTYLNLQQPLAGHPDMVSDDGVHPNDAGYAVIVDAIDKALPRE